MPGAPFHVTAKIALKQQLFRDERMRDTVCRIARESFERVDAQPVGFCIMPNHMHLVLIQGDAPLRDLMQPMLRRIALRVQKRYCVTGRVFSARFFSKPCTNAKYLRTVIVYTHLNPCKRGIVESPDEYRWSSHRLYASGSVDNCLSELITPHLGIFSDSLSDSATAKGYLEYVQFRRDRRAARAAGKGSKTVPPRTEFGDRLWLEQYLPRAPLLSSFGRLAEKPNIQDVARSITDRECPEVGLDYLRGSGRTVFQSRLRGEIVVAASSAGFGGSEIAQFLGISEGRVSQILTANRWSRATARKP